jgi:flagella basal body P-ring formation protein FlgA
LEVTEVSRTAVPAGELEFPLKGLNAGFWRGQVKYGQNGRIDVWARVRVSVKQTRVLTVTSLKPGEVIRAEQLRVDELEAEPDSEFVSSIEDTAGRLPKRAFPAGSPIPVRMLEEPAAVQKGETVRLRAAVGAARLILQAEAQASGKVGDFIAVKNPSSGRIVRARVESAGEVSLTR